jgi:hypothetical protein
MGILSPTSFLLFIFSPPEADSMLIAEEVGRDKQKSGITAFLRMLTLAEWTMGLLCLVIAASGAAGVFVAIQGPTSSQDLVEAAEREFAKFAPSSGETHPGKNRADLQVGKPAQKARNLFKPDERAWVEIGSIDKDITAPDPLLGAHFKYGIYPRNVGKSVAHDVLIMVLEASDNPAFKSNQRAIKTRQDRLFFEPGTNKRSGDKPEAESLAPAEQSALPVYAGAAEPKRLSNGFVVYSYILGRIDYIDVFGTPHWTHFCFFVLNEKGELSPCEYGNDKDNFPEPS